MESRAFSTRISRYRILAWLSSHPAALVFLVALSARWLASTVLLYVSGGGVVFGDDGTYVQLASDFASGATAGWDDYVTQLFHQTATYTYLLTALYWLFGSSVFLGQLVTGIFGAATACLTAHLALKVAPKWAAVSAGLVVALLPSQVLWSSLTLKDAASWAMLVGTALAVARFGRAEAGVRLAVAGSGVLAALALLHFVRPHNFVVAVWAFGLTGWFLSRSARHAAAAVATALLFPLAFGMGLGASTYIRELNAPEEQRVLNAQNAATAFVQPPLSLEDESRMRTAAKAVEAAQENLEQVARLAVSGSTGASDTQRSQRIAAAALALDRARAHAVLVQEALLERGAPALAGSLDEWLALDGDLGRVQGGVVGNLKHLPVGYSVMLLEPYPWRNTQGNPNVAAAKFEMLAWYPLLLLALVGIGAVGRSSRHLIFPLVLAGGIATIYALGEGNFGTAFRHRGDLVWTVALFASLGLHRLVATAKRRAKGDRFTTIGKFD